MPLELEAQHHDPGPEDISLRIFAVLDTGRSFEQGVHHAAEPRMLGEDLNAAFSIADHVLHDSLRGLPARKCLIHEACRLQLPAPDSFLPQGLRRPPRVPQLLRVA
jgi:hypothetical protein